MISNSNFENISSISAVRAKVELYGSALTTCTCEDSLQDFSVSRQGDMSKFFGFGICQKLSLTLIDIERNLQVASGDVIKAYLGDGTTFDKPYPTFTVTEVNRDESNNSITATAYDRLILASKHTFSELGINAPYTIKNVAEAVAGLLELTLKIENVSDDSFDTSYPEGANLEGTEGIREILDAIAECTQTIYFINNEEKLVFKRLDKDGAAVHTVRKDAYYEMNTKTNRRLSAISNVTELGDNVEVSTEETGTTQYIRNNPFWELRTDIATLLNKALHAMGGFTINQFNCDWDGDWTLELGDKIDLITEDDDTVTSYILSDIVTYDGALNEITEWVYTENESETAANPSTLGDKLNQTFARVDKVNKEIELVVSSASENASKIAQLELDLDGINLTLEQHQEQIDNIDVPEVDFTEVNEKIAQIELEIDNIELSVSETDTKISNAVDEAKEYTDEQVTNVVTTTEQKIASLQVSTESINASVKSLESKVTTKQESTDAEIDRLVKEVNLKMDEDDVTILVSNKLESGVDKVTTSSKKYTFDDNGLSVSSSGNNLSTMITEDGMQVYRAGTEVLVANNEGVRAEDLHATTYLIIGTTSRLEDRLNRTACYWIGD